MTAFCTRCGRKHAWADALYALCPCGRVLEPQTEQHFFEGKHEHSIMLKHMRAALTASAMLYVEL